MSTLSIHQTRRWIKQSEHPVARKLLHIVKALRAFEISLPRPICHLLYNGYRTLRTAVSELMRVFWWTPLFKGRLTANGKRLNLYGGLPYISGPLQISLGDDCRISGQTTFTGRTVGSESPRLIVGHNVDISWMTTIAVGRQVRIGDNVRIAGRAFLAGYPGHPLNAEERAAGLPEADEQVGDIILENDVWLATGVSVMAGVRIGRGTIVAAGSVVTRDLPAFVLAGGIPAKVIHPLDGGE
ncbi:MAG: acyltransferase [Sedimenticola sp.]